MGDFFVGEDGFCVCDADPPVTPLVGKGWSDELLLFFWVDGALAFFKDRGGGTSSKKEQGDPAREGRGEAVKAESQDTGDGGGL